MLLDGVVNESAIVDFFPFCSRDRLEAKFLLAFYNNRAFTEHVQVKYSMCDFFFNRYQHFCQIMLMVALNLVKCTHVCVILNLPELFQQLLHVQLELTLVPIVNSTDLHPGWSNVVIVNPMSSIEVQYNPYPYDCTSLRWSRY